MVGRKNDLLTSLVTLEVTTTDVGSVERRGRVTRNAKCLRTKSTSTRATRLAWSLSEPSLYRRGAADGNGGADGVYPRPGAILRPAETSRKRLGLEPLTATSLLDEFGKLPSRIARPQTFMEIGGYPHYENVCSNFLGFFFDPEGPHGLGNLFLDALMGSMGEPAAEGGLGGNVSVEREVTTEAGNRIDLLITSDSHAVLIENKIYAAVANPFEDYASYLSRMKNEDGDRYHDANRAKILLTLYPSREGARCGFVNVTYADFSGAGRSRLGHHVSEADTRHLTFMLDFLNTLENLGVAIAAGPRHFAPTEPQKSDEELWRSNRPLSLNVAQPAGRRIAARTTGELIEEEAPKSAAISGDYDERHIELGLPRAGPSG